MFDTTKEDLKDILKKIDSAAIQLPDFQRSYVWLDDDVRSLIASIAKGFPVGALLTLENGGDVRFKPRLIEGVPEKQVAPVELLLDGQQRMTSLYQATFSDKPVKTLTVRNTTIDRYYYIDIEEALKPNADIMNSIIGVPADRVLKGVFGRDVVLDVSTKELEFSKNHFPLNKVFDRHEWLYQWTDYWRAQGKDIYAIQRDFDQKILEKIDRYKMPIIRLDKSNSREAICLVFEKVNVGGKKLDAFELVTAIYAADNFDLREDWLSPRTAKKPGRKAQIIGYPNPRDVLKEISNTDFLQACTLLHTMENRTARYKEGKRDKELPQVSCNRESLLQLPLEAYQKYADPVEEGFIEAAAFLNESKIIWHKDVPYPPSIVALAAVFAATGHIAQTAKSKEILRKWFWSITLGELYGSMTDSRLSRDVPELVEWIRGNATKTRSIDEAIFQDYRLNTLRSRLSAAYKGVHALLMNSGCMDFITGKPVDIMTFFNDKIDVHHIFPQDWCKKQKIEPAVYNSIINKTPLSKKTNILIQGVAPSQYLKTIEDEYSITPEKLDKILESHLINPVLLRKDDFEGFYEDRKKRLAHMIEQAMDKPVVVVNTTLGMDDDFYDPELEDDSAEDED